MSFDPTSLSQDKLTTFRKAAEAAWGDDTRHEKFAGHPNLAHGQCFVTSKWLTKHWGGYVGVKNGHYFWVSPDKTYAVDLTGDAHPHGSEPGPVLYKRTSHSLFKDLRVKTDTPETPRAKLFSKRADNILAGHKTADLMGADPYPGSTPQSVEDMNQKFFHDEPWVPENDDEIKQYKYFWANGKLHVSPIHSIEELHNLARVSADYNGPLATGLLVVRGGRARWTVATNTGLRGLASIFTDYGEKVGWQFDGIEGQDLFGPKRRMYYSWNKGLVLSERPLQRFAGIIDVAGGVAKIRSGSLADDNYSEGLRDWAKDFGYKLAEYPGTETDFNDKIKNEEGLETFNRIDPNWEPEKKTDLPPDTNFSCPACNIPLDSFGEYMLHVQNHHPDVDPIEDGHFPRPGEIDDPLPAHRHNSEPVAIPLASFREASVVPGFELYAKLWGYDRDDGLIFYGGYDNGELLGYTCVRPDGDKTEIIMIHAVPGRGLGLTMTQKVIEYHPNVYSHAGSEGGERVMRRLGFVNVKGQKWVYSAGSDPKDMIEAEIPFIFDVQQDHITIGHPGTKTSDITHPISGRFTPGGIVEGYYAPGGKVSIQNMTDQPYSVRHMLDLWYHSHPQMEVTSVELRDAAGNTTKVAASQSVGQYIRTLATTDPAAWSAYQTLKKAGGQVYVVGGAVRDALLQREPKDIDLMVAGLPPEEVEHALSKVKGSVNLTGKKFGVYRYNTGGSEVEIALPRQDKYESGRRGEGQITVDHTLPIKKDLERRDFTVNSMAVNLDNGQLIDPFGGAKDIERKTLRTTHPSSFEEDPTRLVRALVASSRHGLVPDERTRREMTENASKLGGESPDITGRELDKLFQSPNPAGAIRLAQETGVLHQLLPELAHNFDFDQNNPHHNFSLGDHSLNVLDHISRNSTDPDLRLAALLHDVGKPNSAWVDPVTGYNHYYEGPNHQGADHETLGAQMVGDRLRQLRYPNSRIHRIQSLVEQHMWPAFNTPKGARKFLNRVGDNADDLLALRNADVDGKGNDIGVIAPDGGITDVERMRGLVEQSRSAQDPTQQSALSINGNDILGLGVPPGPQVGQVLRNLTNDVIDDPTLNQRDTLLQRAKEYANAQPVQQGVV